jgi:hypothetical protein
MTRFEFDIVIAAPIADIYGYVSNPGNWVEWYPGTTEVDGAPAGPLQVGDSWKETLEVAGLSIRFSWTATAVEAPHAWTLEGDAKIHGPLGLFVKGGTATLHYRLNEDEGGTRFHRAITYRYSNPLLRLANRLLLKRKIGEEFEAGLRRLKRIIEDRQETRAPSAEPG